MKTRALFITRSDIGRYSKNANVYQKPYRLSREYDLTLWVNNICHVPDEIASSCQVRRFSALNEVLENEKACQTSFLIFTGFDFPCMWLAVKLKRLTGAKWTVFCWDPPALSHRDRFPPLRWAIDLVFRWFLRRCDKLVLNIHPGLLDEIGYKPREGQLECRLQDAFDGLAPAPITDSDSFDYDFGVLSNWTVAKGSELMTEAMRQMPDKSCLWIGDPPHSNIQTFEHSNISFSGRLPQEAALKELKKCRVLVAPYLSVPSLKWNYVLKLFEYLQLGQPILASDNPGNAAVAEKFPGRITLFKSGDAVDFVNRARELMSKRPGARIAEESSPVKILHIVPGLAEPANGIAVAAKMMAGEQSKAKHEVEVVGTRDIAQSGIRTLKDYSEAWVHSMWQPRTVLACWLVLRAGVPLVRMTHANLDPVRLAYHGWRKRLVGPIERWLFRHSDRIVATCEAEREWIRAYVGRGCPEIVVEDLKRLFDLDQPKPNPRAEVDQRNLHVLYLGRRHPLKGVALLERAVSEFNQSIPQSGNQAISQSVNLPIDLRIVSNAFGAEKEIVWAWCDVLVLPTLSENFGLVVAEALERGKRVITTDGAPVWGEGEMSECSECLNVRIGYGGRLIYLKGYRDGADERRVELLRCAIERVMRTL